MGTEGRREAREDSAEGPGSPGAESETFRTRTCWSQCCHCSPAGQVSVITELRGLPPPRGMGTAEKHRSVHTYIPLPPSLMQAWEEVGMGA